MNARLQRFGAALAAFGLLAACGDDRVSSTEVENEVSTLVASSEDTAPIVAARWVLSDSSATIARGVTDSTGSIAVDFPTTASSYLFLRIESPSETLQTIIDLRNAEHGDTIRTGVNLLTNAVARAWHTAPHHQDFARFGDSLAHSITGMPLGYGSFALPADRRMPEAQVFLDVLGRKARRAPGPMIPFVDSLARTPGASMLHDSSFSRDLADILREQGTPPDSQTAIVQRIDSIGGQYNALVAAFERQRQDADSLLLTEIVPWLGSPAADGFCRILLARASMNANRILAQPRPAFPPDLVMETGRRLALRTYARLLDDIASPPDSAGLVAFTLLLDEADSTMRETFRTLKIDPWFGKDVALDQLLSPILTAARSQNWSSSALLAAIDPRAAIASGWPLPHGTALRKAIEASIATGAWGSPYQLLIPDSSKY